MTEPTIINDFPGAMVDWHLRTYGILPGQTQCPLLTCLSSQRESGRRRCELDLPACAAQSSERGAEPATFPSNVEKQ